MTEDKQEPLDDAELAQRLVDQARSEGVSLTGHAELEAAGFSVDQINASIEAARTGSRGIAPPLSDAEINQLAAEILDPTDRCSPATAPSSAATSSPS